MSESSTGCIHVFYTYVCKICKVWNEGYTFHTLIFSCLLHLCFTSFLRVANRLLQQSSQSDKGFLQFLNPNPAGCTLVVREKGMEEDRELLRMWFESVDEDNSNSINAQELQVGIWFVFSSVKSWNICKHGRVRHRGWSKELISGGWDDVQRALEVGNLKFSKSIVAQMIRSATFSDRLVTFLSASVGPNDAVQGFDWQAKGTQTSWCMLQLWMKQSERERKRDDDVKVVG